MANFLESELIKLSMGTGTEAQLTYNGTNYPLNGTGILNLVSGNYAQTTTVGTAYRFRVTNASSGAFAWTIVTNTGWTLGGTMTINQNTWREFVLTLNSLTTATLQSVATGTFS